MTTLLSIPAIFLSILAIFAYQWVTFIPQLGMFTLYHLRWVRLGVAMFALGSALVAYMLNPTNGQLVVIFVTILLTPLSGANHAKRFLVSLDRPQHLTAVQSSLPDDAQVLGIVLGETAVAWPLELLIPHHIANEQLNGAPVMAAW